MKVKESDYFHEGMSWEEKMDALQEFVIDCQKAHQPIPLWARMQMDDEESITPPDYKNVNVPELKKALEDIDKEFGVKK